MRILVVEDTPEIAEAIVRRLERMGHAADWEISGATASELVLVQDYDLVILDLTLPEKDGICVLKEIRSRGQRVPILVITARSAVDERISALDLGADDYLTKPFDYRELEARSRALLRRHTGIVQGLLTIDSLVIDTAGRHATLAGKPLNLTRRELTVLEILAAQPERIVPKERLIEQLFNFDQAPSANAIEQFVGRLRRKLSGSRIEIRTIRNLGYQLAKL
jgi:two-component system response regulator TctD